MNQALQEKIESEQYRKDDAKFAVGDSVRSQVMAQLGRGSLIYAAKLVV